MVAYPVGGGVAGPGGNSYFCFQLGHCLGALSVLLIHARFAAYSGHLRLLS